MFGLIIISQQVLLRQALLVLLGKYVNLLGAGDSLTQVCEKLNIPSGITPVFLVDADLPNEEIEKIALFIQENQASWALFTCSARSRRLIDLFPLRAHGYLTMDQAPEEFIRLLENIGRGHTVLALSMVPTAFDTLLTVSGNKEGHKVKFLKNLTKREIEIIKLLARGATNEEVARELFISVYTVKNHLHNIFSKLKVQNRAQLVSFALSQGLVTEAPTNRSLLPIK